jgi:hypothetical protein
MHFQTEVPLESGGLVLLQGNTVKYWESEGHADFIGSLQDLNIFHPRVMRELIAKGIVKEV